MRGPLLPGIVLSLFPAAVAGSVTLSLDIVDPSDNIMQPPAGVVCVDVLADVSNGDTWTAGGVRGVALGGAVLRYASDPNTGQTLLTNPGTDDRFTTFYSEPRNRDANGRYNNGGAAAAGRYCPTGATATSTPTEVNVAYFASPPETIDGSLDGYVMRVALDVTGTGHAADEFVVFRLGQEPPGALPFFLSDCDGPNPGTVAATFDAPEISGFDWGVFIVPEPASLLLVVGGALALTVLRGRR